ncbi:hypothetical protein [Robiginitalea sp. SC105]|uniref:hypothetical protein n=1 Tax=Robiginitalea sp. SC105 TaxID=2762332 RepID=UPI00163B46AD|nr:hypothetical protein [Robiginitalea sp. SC105]MBC2838149.1 hypothetical protein [Robiginitalea sp. SC105]
MLGTVGHAQTPPCKEYAIYKVAFEQLAESYQDTLVIDIKNDRGAFLIPDIAQATEFSESQIGQIDSVLSRPWDASACGGVTDLLKEAHANSPGAIRDTYYRITCSRPVFLSGELAILVFSFTEQNKNNDGGEAVGADALDTYVLEGVQWKRISRQPLSYD